MTRRVNLLTALWCALAALGMVASGFAEDDEAKPSVKAKAADKPADEEGKEEEKDAEKKDADKEDEDPFAVPKDASTKELADFIEKMTERPVTSLAEMKKKLAAIDEATTALLAKKDVKGEMAADAVRTKLEVYQLMARFGDEDAPAKAKKFIESLKDDKRPEIARVVAEEKLRMRVADIGDMTEKERHALVNDVVEHAQKSELGLDAFRLALGVARGLEREAPQEAAELYERLGTLFAKSEEERIQDYAKKFAGVARRLRLPGNEIEIEGTTLDGKPFDIKSLEGKVVLVDFWATWCGPCIAELPNVKKNYKLYNKKGFEVVGISLDDDKEALEEFVKEKEVPWITLYGADEKTQGWDHPMAAKYGIMGIPTVILVDQKGKVIELNARGPKLGEHLAKLLGPADEKDAEEKSEESSDAPAIKSTKKKNPEKD